MQDLHKTSADALEFSGYVTGPEYQIVYVKMAVFQMVSMRLPARGDLLSTHTHFAQVVAQALGRWLTECSIIAVVWQRLLRKCIDHAHEQPFEI